MQVALPPGPAAGLTPLSVWPTAPRPPPFLHVCSSFIASWLQEQGRGVLVSVDTWLGSPEFWQQDAMANPEFSLRLVHGWPTIY